MDHFHDNNRVLRFHSADATADIQERIRSFLAAHMKITAALRFSFRPMDLLRIWVRNDEVDERREQDRLGDANPGKGSLTAGIGEGAVEMRKENGGSGSYRNRAGRTE